MAPIPLSPSYNHSSDQPPTTPPATATSFLSFSPSPPAPSRTQILAPPINLTSPISTASTISFDLDAELALSPGCSSANFSSKNPFLVLIARRAQSGPCPSPTPSSDSSLSHSYSTPSPSTSTASSSDSTSERSEREKREERDSVVIYNGSLLHSGGILSVMDEMISEETKEWEEDTGSAWEEELYSSLEETNLEGSSSPPTTPILSVTPSAPLFPSIDATPQAPRINPKIQNSPSPRRKSVIYIASSPRSRTHSTRSSPRTLRSPTSSSISTSRRVSLLPIDAFSQNPTSPILLSTTSPRRTRISHPFGTSSSTLSPRKSKSKSKKSKKPPRSPPHLRPIRKTAEGFDADALDQLFGVPQERRRKNQLIVEGEEEEWRKVEEFRGLLEEGNSFETESEEEEEVLHIRAPSLRTKVARKREKARPPPLNLGIHTNSFASQSQPSSFSPDTATLDGSVIQSPTSAAIDPLSKEIARRKDGAKDGKRVLRGKKSVGERLRGLCGIAV